MNIMVFATSVSGPEQVSRVSPLLTSIPAIEDWNFDLEDCDRILRVVANNVSPRYIESILNDAGFNCMELGY